MIYNPPSWNDHSLSGTRQWRYRRVKRPEIEDTEQSTRSDFLHSTKDKPLGKKYYLNSTNLKRLDIAIHSTLVENLGKKEGSILKNRKGKDRSVKRRKTTDTENVGEYSESAPSIQRANINERVARLLKTAHKYEGNNVEMEEGNIIKNRKRRSLSCTREGMVISRWRIVNHQKGRCEDFDYYRSL